MVQSYSRGFIHTIHVPSHEAMRAHWRYLVNTIELCFLQPTQVDNPNGKSIGSAIFAQLMADCRRACPGMSFTLIIAPSHGGSEPHVIHASLGPPESITQMVAPLVQPFLHRRPHSAPILYNGSPLPPQNCPFPWGMSTPSNIWFLGQTPVFNPNGTLIG